MTYKHPEIEEAYKGFQNQVVLAINDLLSQRQQDLVVLVAQYHLLYLETSAAQERADYTYVAARQQFRASLFKELGKQVQWLQRGYPSWQELIDQQCQLWLSEQAEQLVVREVSTPYQCTSLRNPLLYPAALWFNFRLSLRLGLRQLRNGFRRIVRKPSLDTKIYRQRRLPLRAVLSERLTQEFLPALHRLLDVFLAEYSSCLVGIWELDEAVDNYSFGVLQQQVDSSLLPEAPLSTLKVLEKRSEVALEAFVRDHKSLLTGVFDTADDLMPRLDTLYVSRKRFVAEVQARQVRNAHRQGERMLSSWNRTFLTLLDDWAMDVEISHLYFSVFAAYHRLQEQLNHVLEQELQPAFAEIESYLDESKQRLEEEVAGNPGAILRKERRRAQHDLADRHIARLVEKLSICFSGDFDCLGESLERLVDALTKERSYIKGRAYGAKSAASAIETISPKELLYFEAVPALQRRIKSLRSFSDQRLEEARLQLMGLATVWDFSLESALLLLNEHDGGADKAADAALEGARRALEQVHDALSMVKDIPKKAAEELESGIVQFNADVQNLKNTENVFELNLKLARIKALEQSRQLRQQVLAGFRTLLPQLWRWLKTGYLRVLRLIKDVKLRVGFSAPTKYMTFELSEFINETHEVLNQLPFVYQRLFQLTPTNETRFFVNREKEMGELKQAWNNWQKDRFITVAVIGDKGSGVSSLLNHFLTETHIAIPIVRTTLATKIFTLDHYLDFFNELFKPDQPFSSNEVLISWLNQGPSRIVVIENLQHLYLKQVNGFDNLQRLFELMSNTMKKVFWTGVFTSHTWTYLEKTLYISNYFTHEVFLQPLSASAIEEIITRRNKISGFRLNFLPDPEMRDRKGFMAMEEREQQNHLRQQLFRKLSRLSYGNISLAQLYWLRLTREVHTHSIDIGFIKEIDFSFIKDLKAEELFVLQTLVLHDGLSLTDFCGVMGKSEAAAKNLLIPMLEKGFLIRPHEKFNINPIVFNPVVSYLGSRNFIS